MTENSAITFKFKNDAVWVTLNRPQNRNALTAELVNLLYEFLGSAEEDSSIRGIVITGAGPAFCSGADLKSPPGSTVDGSQSVPYGDVLKRIMDCSKPVIAAINGSAAAGGLGLIGAADIVISVDDAHFSFREVRVGVIPGVIAVVCLPKIGPHIAMKLFLTGERFTSEQAVDYGLVHRVVPREQLVSAVNSELDAIKLGGPNAIKECKRLVRQVPTWSRDEGLVETQKWSTEIFQSDEAAEGIAAFIAKRNASWIKD
ncbi:MAG: enoyl-CoA hydratase [Gammaproteobacteria bacterium]|nr:enoyl-CoA hydratase [Gammaproteobacteria bacterium]MYC25861.1 enoyl-CoA hydratase [Gammaproteobacteria bacterium]